MNSAAFDLRDSAPSKQAPQSCAHCGLPVPASAHVDSGPAFCCAGCHSVYEIVHAAGLTGYYAYRDVADAAKVQAIASRRKYEELDDPGFLASQCRAEAGGSMSAELVLEGVHCSACVWLIERIGRIVPGVVSARFDLGRSVVAVAWDPARVRLSEVARGFASLGYSAHPSSAAQTLATRVRDRALLLKLGVAGAIAGNVMLMALALYSGAFSGMETAYQSLFRWTSFAVATPAVFWAGSVFLRGGLAALRTRTPHMDLPVSIGILAGYVGGAINTLTGRGEIYADLSVARGALPSAEPPPAVDLAG
jgi:P-type Cu2+ transporter